MLYKIEILDLKTGKRFTKKFNSFYQYQKFKRKLYYSKKLRVVGTEAIQ